MTDGLMMISEDMRGLIPLKLTQLEVAEGGRLFGYPAMSARARSIGTYEDLVRERYERDWAAAPPAQDFKICCGPSRPYRGHYPDPE
ncbi:hypothetical protein [Woodsholea maritima]|uniref:hypothetical protein n=1 Tax=Woodsholea maritima TaxID=240237 RepID=UPI00035D77BB|nr:hypothetical protein [Woodsholea maritima]